MIATASTSATPESLFTASDAARLLRVSLSWLAKSRLTGTGPRFVKVGRSVRYPESFLANTSGCERDLRRASDDPSGEMPPGARL